MAIRRTKQRTTQRGSSKGSNEEGGMNNQLHELFLEELADIYNAEQQLTKALPKLAKATRNEELRNAFQMHLEETQNHISRLDELAENLGESLKRKKCKGMEGLIEEGEEVMDEMEDSEALDAALIMAAQKVEHYEIAAYGSLCSWAELMGHNEALNLLKETLSEEKDADEKLTQIAESAANLEARNE
jgi:ferritin-like metal-binding protein YciE